MVFKTAKVFISYTFLFARIVIELVYFKTFWLVKLLLLRPVLFGI